MKYLISVLLIIFIAENSHADRGEFIFSFAAIANNTVNKVENNKDVTKYDIGAAILFEANVNSYIGIETGGLFIDRQYDVEAGSLRLIENVKRLHIPVMFRLWPVDFISIGAGPYASLKLGNTTRKVEIGNITAASLKTSADKESQYGLDAAVTLNLALYNKSGLFLEGRYSSPFEKEKNENSDELTALLGIKLSL